MKQQYSGGWIEVVCGCMFSGKSEELIRRVRRSIIAKQQVQIFKPDIDTRWSQNSVGSHSGVSLDAIPVTCAGEILQELDSGTEVVAIDEAQFFDDSIITVCEGLADRGLRVIVACLDMDFRGEPFGPAPLLIAIADQVDKLQAICMSCGAPASRTQRMINGEPAPYNAPIVVVGAADMYEARCRACHDVPGRPKQGKQG